MKNGSISGKTWLKNQRLFQELCVLQPKKFLLPLMKIRKILRLPKIKDIGLAMQLVGDNPTQKDWDKLFEVLKQCGVNRANLFKLFNKEDRGYFYKLIDQILIDNKLGTEWTYPLIDLVISGIFMPPIYNLVIQSNKEHRALCIKLNPSTSIEDIKDAWGLIQSQKKIVFKGISRRNLTDKSVDHLVTKVKMDKIKKRYPKLKGTGILGELYPEMDNKPLDGEADRKLTNNLRQIKSRLSRKV